MQCKVRKFHLQQAQFRACSVKKFARLQCLFCRCRAVQNPQISYWLERKNDNQRLINTTWRKNIKAIFVTKIANFLTPISLIEHFSITIYLTLILLVRQSRRKWSFELSTIDDLIHRPEDGGRLLCLHVCASLSAQRYIIHTHKKLGWEEPEAAFAPQAKKMWSSWQEYRKKALSNKKKIKPAQYLRKKMKQSKVK